MPVVQFNVIIFQLTLMFYGNAQLANEVRFLLEKLG